MRTIFLDTGPLGLVTNPKKPTLTVDALQWAAEHIRAGNRLMVPLGLHIGAGLLVTEEDASLNVLGDGINTAQRVMDCGNAGHILLSDAYAALLLKFEEWKPHLYPLGEYTVRHEQKIKLWNYVSPDCGNPNPPTQKPRFRLLSFPILPWKPPMEPGAH